MEGRRRPREAGGDGHPHGDGDEHISAPAKRSRRDEDGGDPVRDALLALGDELGDLSAEVRELSTRGRAGHVDAARVDRLRSRVRSLADEARRLNGSLGPDREVGDRTRVAVSSSSRSDSETLGKTEEDTDCRRLIDSEVPGTKMEDDTDGDGDRGDDRGSAMYPDESKSKISDESMSSERDCVDDVADVASSGHLDDEDEDEHDPLLVASEEYLSEGRLAFCCQNCRSVHSLHTFSLRLLRCSHIMQTHTSFPPFPVDFAASPAAARGGARAFRKSTCTCGTAATTPATADGAAMPGTPSSTTKAAVIPRSS